MGQAAGTKLGPYEVLSSLGAGGMGEVYRARDPRLGRDVAIKVLPASFAADPIRLRRFEQEARAVAALSHVNVLAVFDIGIGPVPFLVTELLDGDTLRIRLARGPVPPMQCVTAALQLVAGLGAAHARGIVHRDLKPENIFLTRDGGLKILDFGLAKAVGAAATPGPTADRADGDQSPTMMETLPGLVVGTVGYMAPEQVRGEPVDARADLFAVGAILHEMLTGRRTFQGQSAADTMSAVLREQPADLSLQSGVPSALVRIVNRCLEKATADRFQSARDVAFALDSVFEARAPGAPAAATDEKSIAVLPFEDLSSDRSQQAFCEGMAAEIINALTVVSGLRVISRTSAVRCREKGLDIGEIGSHLKVQTVLEGTVRKAGERLRVTAQLVQTSDGSQMWASRFDRGAGDIFDIQDEISAAIVEKLKVRLSGAGMPAVKRVTDNIEAYNLYLKGRYYWERRNEQFLKVAQDYFERAIAADPEYALAHAGVADCQTALAILGFCSGADVLSLAKASAERALALDPNLAEAHHALGALRLWIEWDWTGGDAALRRALELNPRLGISHAYRAAMLAWLRQEEEAIQEARRGMELEPDSPVMTFIAGNVFYWLRSFDASLELENQALKVDPGAFFVHWIRTPLLTDRGDHEAAIAAIEGVLAGGSRPVMLLAALGRAYARAGRVPAARQLLDELLRRRSQDYVAPLYLGELCVALDDRQRACDWLEQAYEHRNGYMPSSLIASRYDVMRDEPRVAALLKRMNLA
jgi:eukaryotic-like serine/threonine-protein kinase